MVLHHIRVGSSISVFIAKSSLFANQFVNLIGLALLSWKYYFVSIGWLAVQALIMLLNFPNTKSPSLGTMRAYLGACT